MIALIRHAAVAGGEGRYIGSTELPLSPEGEAQALALAEELGQAPLAAIYTSPLGRARHTAAPLAARLGLEVRILDELAEIHLGLWEGLDREEVRRSRPGEYEARGRDFAGYRPPGGENFDDLARRAEAALQRMNAGPLPCAAVTHAGVIRVLLCRALARPLDDAFRFRPAHAHCTLLRTRQEASGEEGHFPFRLVGQDLSPAAASSLLLP